MVAAALAEEVTAEATVVARREALEAPAVAVTVVEGPAEQAVAADRVTSRQRT